MPFSSSESINEPRGVAVTAARKERRFCMAFGFRIEAWGDRALFTRPELSVERVTYDVITPSAARGLIESVYWHPGMRYVIDRIHVINPIKFSSVRRNEVTKKASVADMKAAVLGSKDLPYISSQENIAQRASLILTDVRYVIDAHFVMTDLAKPADNPGKFCEILKRRLRKGQCYSQPYFGCREFAANVSLMEKGHAAGAYDDVPERDFGIMLYDMDYSNPEDITPMFYRAVMRNGVIDVAGSEVYR